MRIFGKIWILKWDLGIKLYKQCFLNKQYTVIQKICSIFHPSVNHIRCPWKLLMITVYFSRLINDISFLYNVKNSTDYKMQKKYLQTQTTLIIRLKRCEIKVNVPINYVEMKKTYCFLFYLFFNLVFNANPVCIEIYSIKY